MWEPGHRRIEGSEIGEDLAVRQTEDYLWQFRDPLSQCTKHLLEPTRKFSIVGIRAKCPVQFHLLHVLQINEWIMSISDGTSHDTGLRRRVGFNRPKSWAISLKMEQYTHVIIVLRYSTMATEICFNLYLSEVKTLYL